MLSVMPEQGVPTAPAPPVPPAPPKKPPIVLFIVLGLVVVCGLCACLGAGSLVLFRSTGTGTGTGIIEPLEPQGSSPDDIIAGVEEIARGCERFAGDNGYGPSVDDVSPEGAVAGYVDGWPENPISGGPMRQGSEPGDFIFHTATSMGDGQEYLGYIDAILSDGSTYSVEFSY